MTARCIDCKHITLREHPKHANEGLGQCKRDAKSGEFFSYLYRRECKQYDRAAEEVILKRMAWRDQLEIFRRVEK
jgi:hypothetical protein